MTDEPSPADPTDPADQYDPADPLSEPLGPAPVGDAFPPVTRRPTWRERLARNAATRRPGVIAAASFVAGVLLTLLVGGTVAAFSGHDDGHHPGWPAQVQRQDGAVPGGPNGFGGPGGPGGTGPGQFPVGPGEGVDPDGDNWQGNSG